MLVNQSGSIFDRPPAGLQGYVFKVEDPSELVLGYFEVTSIDTIRTFLQAIDFEGKYQFIEYFSNRFPNRYTMDCCNCTLIDGSSLTAPYYW